MNPSFQILITNDDSINAKGISNLIKIAREFGQVTVVAPQQPQSAQSCAVSVGQILRLIPLKEEPGLRVFTCNGTPIDCVKIAVSQLFSEKLPDLLLSGINHGSNSSAGAMYSGTLGAAAEAIRYGFPAVGYSLCTHDSDANFDAVLYYGRQLLASYLKQQIDPGTYLNVNFPNIPQDKIKGFAFARLGKGNWINEFEKRIDPNGRPYYWLTGQYQNVEPTAETDQNYLDQGYITITPLTTDTTNYSELARLKDSWQLP